MRTTLVVLTLLCLPPVALAQGWETVDFYIAEDITGIDFLGPDTAFLVTSGGTIARTFDAGVTWQARVLEADIPLEDIEFADSNHGFVCGRNGRFFMSNDGGLTWQNYSLGDTTDWLLSIEMIDARTGVMVGMKRKEFNLPEGYTLRTTNGGRSWDEQKSRGAGYGELFNLDNRILYFPSYGRLQGSLDQGKTWSDTKIDLPKPGREVAIMDRTGLLVGNLGLCAYSTDAGLTWTEVTLDTQAHLTSVLLLTPQVGCIAGHEGVIMFTRDGGKTWERDAVDKMFDIYDLVEVGDWLYAVGSEGNIIRKRIRQ